MEILTTPILIGVVAITVLLGLIYLPSVLEDWRDRKAAHRRNSSGNRARNQEFWRMVQEDVRANVALDLADLDFHYDRLMAETERERHQEERWREMIEAYVLRAFDSAVHTYGKDQAQVDTVVQKVTDEYLESRRTRRLDVNF